MTKWYAAMKPHLGTVAVLALVGAANLSLPGCAAKSGPTHDPMLVNRPPTGHHPKTENVRILTSESNPTKFTIDVENKGARKFKVYVYPGDTVSWRNVAHKDVEISFTGMERVFGVPSVLVYKGAKPTKLVVREDVSPGEYSFMLEGFSPIEGPGIIVCPPPPLICR